MQESLFEQYGGFGFVSRVISAYYNSILDSDRLAGYFENVDMPRLIDHQTKFFATLMGGPISFSDAQLLRAHAHLGVDSEAFNEVITILRETLQDFDMDEGDIGIIVAEAVNKKHLIVTA